MCLIVWFFFSGQDTCGGRINSGKVRSQSVCEGQATHAWWICGSERLHACGRQVHIFACLFQSIGVLHAFGSQMHIFQSAQVW